jgi:hypothetical protein
MIWVFWRDWDVYSSKAPFALAVSIICLISGTFVCIRARTHAKRYQRVFRGIDWDRTDLSDPHMMQFQRGHVGLPTSRYEAYSLTAGVFSKSVATTTYSIVFITVAWLGVGVLVAMGLRG